MKLLGYTPDVLLCTLHGCGSREEVLETYALYKVLSDMGHKPIVCDYYSNKKEIESNNYAFLKNRTVMSSDVYDDNTYKAYAQKFDILVTGTQGIWDWNEIADIDYMFLNMGKEDAKRISYAPSFGEACTIPLGPKNAAFFSLDKHSALGIADYNSLRILEIDLKKTADKVCMPILLNNEYPERDEYKDDWFMVADIKERGLQTMKILEMAEASRKFRIDNISEGEIDISILAYIDKIRCSQLVISDSFDTIQMAIILKKPFIALLSKNSYKVRVIQTILEELGLDERIIYFEEDVLEKKYLCKKPINYEYIDKKLTKIRENSVEWLRKSANGGEDER